MEGKKVVVVGAGPVGSLAALYAANRGATVYIYELRNGESVFPLSLSLMDLSEICRHHGSSVSPGLSLLFRFAGPACLGCNFLESQE
jgi:glutamate dehydrogenase/leucine dehydrogenase